MTDAQALELRALAGTYEQTYQLFQALGLMNTATDPVARADQTFHYEKARAEMLVAERRLREFQMALAS